MSKQSEAKAAQGYVAKAVPQTCMNCANFAMDTTERTSQWSSTVYFDETNLRCTLGGFAVKKMGTCREFSEPVMKREEPA